MRKSTGWAIAGIFGLLLAGVFVWMGRSGQEGLPERAGGAAHNPKMGQEAAPGRGARPFQVPTGRAAQPQLPAVPKPPPQLIQPLLG